MRIKKLNNIKPIVIFGGTFDPIHNGHLQIIEFVLQKLDPKKIKQVRFMPCNLPAIKSTPIANAKQRVEMLKLVIGNKKNLIADDREIKRGGISYMIDTLQELRKQFLKPPFFLILGEDAFFKLNTWKSWQELKNYCHFIVLKRKYETHDICCELKQFIAENATTNINDLFNFLSGKILFLETDYVDISATEIRRDINTKKITQLLPEKVFLYIKKNHLYNFINKYRNKHDI